MRSYLPILSAALGAFGAAAAFLSYGNLGVLPALLTLLAAGIGAALLSRLPAITQRIGLAGAFLIGILLLFLWRTGFEHSALALSYPFLDTLAAPYNLDLPHPYLPDPRIGGGDALTAFLLALAWLFAAGSISRIFHFLAGLVSLFLTFGGLYFSVQPPAYAVLLGAAYWIAIPAKDARRNWLAPLVPFGSVLLAGLLILIAVPSSTYRQPDIFRHLSLAITSALDGSWFHAGSAYNDLLRGVDGKHRLGTADGLRYTGRNLVRIASEPVTHRLYIRSEIGSAYKDSAWHDLPDSDYAGISDLFEKNQGQWYDQSAWLMEVAYQNPGLGDEMNGYLSDPAPIASRRHFFSVPEVYEETTHLFIPYDTSFAASLFSYDRAPVSNEGKAYESYRWDLPLSAAYAFVQNSQSQDSYFLTYTHMENAYRRFVYSHYTDVPDGLLAGITGGLPIPKAATNEEKRQWVHAVQQYFKTNYTYDIRPGRTPDDEDFIVHFLNISHKGYCTAFASAGVMLMRAAGIPARYVVGVTAGAEEIQNAPRSSEGYPMLDLDDSHAHAWAEIYVDGIGWRPVEFTPGVEGGEDPIPTPPERNGSGNPPDNTPSPENNTPKDQPANKPQEQQPQNQPDHEGKRDTGAQNAQQKTPQPKQLPPRGGQPARPQALPGSFLPLFILSLIIPAILLLIYLAVRIRLSAVPRMFQQAEHTGKGGPLFAYVLRLAAWAGHPAPSGSYHSWAKALSADPRFGNLPALVALLTRARFSGVPPTKEECTEAVEIVRGMRAAAQAPLSRKKRILFLLVKRL